LAHNGTFYPGRLFLARMKTFPFLLPLETRARHPGVMMISIRSGSSAFQGILRGHSISGSLNLTAEVRMMRYRVILIPAHFLDFMEERE